MKGGFIESMFGYGSTGQSSSVFILLLLALIGLFAFMFFYTPKQHMTVAEKREAKDSCAAKV